MSFSSEWDSIYIANQQMSIWPWSDLVSYVMRYAKPKSDDFRVLELGCGAGANIPFFQSLKADYYATEGSPSVVKSIIEKYPSLNDKVKVADFTKIFPFDVKFDLIVDRAAVTHNTTNAIKNCISLMFKKMNPNGIFIGIDWFSTAHSEFKNGVFPGDINTKNNFSVGQFHQVGHVHFSDKTHICELFNDFEFLKIEHKIVKQDFPETDYQMATYNFVIKKINE